MRVYKHHLLVQWFHTLFPHETFLGRCQQNGLSLLSTFRDTQKTVVEVPSSTRTNLNSHTGDHFVSAGGLHRIEVLTSCWYRTERNSISIGPTVRLYLSIHHSDGMMSAKASQIAGVLIVCSSVCVDADNKTTPKLRVTGLCEGNPSVTGCFPSQRASYAEKFSIWWLHHES